MVMDKVCLKSESTVLGNLMGLRHVPEPPDNTILFITILFIDYYSLDKGTGPLLLNLIYERQRVPRPIHNDYLYILLLSNMLFQTTFVPIKQFLDTFIYLNLMRPTQRVQLAHVNELAHSAIGLAGIKGYFTLKAYGLDNELGELTDGEFLTGAHIDMAVADLAQSFGYF